MERSTSNGNNHKSPYVDRDGFKTVNYNTKTNNNNRSNGKIVNTNNNYKPNGNNVNVGNVVMTKPNNNNNVVNETTQNNKYKSNSSRSNNWRNNDNKTYGNSNEKKPYVQTNEQKVNKWLLSNLSTLTFDGVKKQIECYKDDTINYYIIKQLIKYLHYTDKPNINHSKNIITILEKIGINNLWPKFNNSPTIRLCNFGLFHNASFVQAGCDVDIFTRLVKLLYSKSYHPFSTNNLTDDDDNHETGFMALFVPVNKLEYEERLLRYKIYLKHIPTTLIPKILTSHLNKNFEKTIDIARFCICVDPYKTMEILATNILITEYKNITSGKLCDTIDNKVRCIIEIFNGASDSFRNTKIIDKSLELYFTFDEINCFTTDKLYEMFLDIIERIRLSTKNENKHRNDITYIRMLGSFANNNIFVNECNKNINETFNKNNLENITHILPHIGFVTKEFKEYLNNMQKSNMVTIMLLSMFDSLSDDKNGIKYIKTIDCNHELFKIIPNEDNHGKNEDLNIDLNLKLKIDPNNINRYELGIRDFISRIKILYGDYPNNHQMIVRHIIVLLIEYNTKIENIVEITKILIDENLLDKQLFRNETYYIENTIDEGNMDKSSKLCLQIWMKMLELFNNV